MSEKISRILSGAIIFAAALIIFIFGNVYTVDIVLCIVALRCVYELSKTFEKKEHKPIKWVTYVACIPIALMHIVPVKNLMFTELIIPIAVVLCFMDLIFRKENKRTALDVTITVFEILYIVVFLSIFSKIRAMENGKYLIWYVFISAWLTDVFALYTGKAFGKHHFTSISPNKTIEGCIGGLAGAVIGCELYTILLSNLGIVQFGYVEIIIYALFLSAIGQIGDLAASSIKRYAGVKDFSNLIPGHGGMLDRIDSIIFIVPLAYIILTTLI